MEKLNKKQEGVYVIEEEKDVANGKWEGYLNHDNVNHQTIAIYTGPKLTGEKIDNYFVSTPSEMPWKTHIKAFSKSEKIYITYETTGDQVEAEDINNVQDEIVNEIERATAEERRIDTKVDNEIVRAITEDEILSEDVEELKEKKANKTYVDTELNKKYNKDEVFTKEEVLQQIENIIDAAPEALNTLGKIAEALNEDPDFAATMTTELSKKVDKVAGKGLSDENYTLAEKKKLLGVEEYANKYTHPSTHPASMITESSSRRFASDVEKANWNDKWDYDEETIKNVKVNNAKDSDTVNGKAVAVDVPANAKFTDTTYSEITEVEIDEGTSSTKRTITGRRIKYILDMVRGWMRDAIELAEHEITKLGVLLQFLTNGVEDHMSNKDNPHKTTKEQIGLDKVDNIKQATKSEFNNHDNDNTRHITFAERDKWNRKAEASDVPTKVGQLENDKKYVTQEELGSAGYGDMTKGIYDTNNNGKVDVAENSEKLGNQLPSYYQQALGYTPVNKAGDNMTGDLKINGNITAGTELIVGYNGTSESLQRHKWKYNGSTGALELWRYSNQNKWELSVTFPNRNTGSGGITVEGMQVATEDYVDNKVKTNVPANAKFTDTVYIHPGSGTNPHNTTRSDIGLGNVSNYFIATQSVAEAGTSNSYYMTPLRVKQAIDKNAMSKGPLTWNELKGV